ncbi:transposase [Streptomyces sp. ISL-96]|nr:transposase [Streptomyces sp. ISL-96]
MQAVVVFRGGFVSLRGVELAEIPGETVRVARAVFPKGCLAMRVRDVLGPHFTDADFEELFPVRGRPAVSPARLALVSVLQFAEGLTDRQAAHAVRSRLDWKYALSLELTDTGFDFSVLSEFRSRLVDGHARAGRDEGSEPAGVRGRDSAGGAEPACRGSTAIPPGRRTAVSRLGGLPVSNTETSAAPTERCCWRPSGRSRRRPDCGFCLRWSSCAGRGCSSSTKSMMSCAGVSRRTFRLA